MRAIDVTIGTGGSGVVRDPARLADRIFPVLLALAVGAVWTVEHFPSQDGPQHVENIDVWTDLDAGGPRANYFVLNPHLAPYWATQLALRGLLALFAPPVADKILVSGLILFFALALRYLLTSVGDSGRVLAVLALPFATSWFLHMGFYGYVAGTACALLATGYYVRAGPTLRMHQTAVLLGLLVLAYAAHLIGLVVACTMISATLVGRAVADARGDLGRGVASLRRSLSPVVLAAAPALVLTAMYVLGSAQQADSSTVDPNYLRFIGSIVLLVAPLASFSPIEAILSAALAACLACLVCLALRRWTTSRRGWQWTDAFVVAAVSVGICSVLMPATAAGGTIVRERVAFTAVLCLVVWLAAQPMAALARGLTLVAGTVLTAGTIGSHVVAYQAWDDKVSEVVALGRHVRPGSTVLPMTFLGYREQPYFYRVQPLLYSSTSWIVIEHDAVGLANIDASTPYAPVAYRPSVDPYEHLDQGADDGFETPPPRVDFRGYAARTGGPVDYVLVIGFDEQQGFRDEKAAFLAELASRYELVAQSGPQGIADLYRARAAGS